jgi:hypothetical protein
MDAEAENCYRQGIEIASRKQDMHALGELQNAFTNFRLGLDDSEE